MPANASPDQPLVIIRKPPAILWIAALFALPFVALALFVPRFRVIGVLFVIFAAIRFARQTLSVRVTDKEITLQTAFTRRRYSVEAIKQVELGAAQAAIFGTTTSSVRLDFFDGPPLEISSFPSNEINALYQAVLTAWHRVQSASRT